MSFVTFLHRINALDLFPCLVPKSRLLTYFRNCAGAAGPKRNHKPNTERNIVKMSLNGFELRTNGRKNMRKPMWSRIGILGISMGVTCVALLQPTEAKAQLDWANFGANSANTASNPLELLLNPLTVPFLKPKWTFTTGGDVSTKPAVVNGVVYFPDWGGNLWALNAQTGVKIWGNQFSSYGLAAGTVSRSTPAIGNGVLYIGTQQGAWFLAINAKTGALLWKTELETVDPNAVITTSPTVVNGVVYTGIASTQETIPGGGGPARGSVVAVNAETGAILWKTYTTVVGYTGAGVWGSSPVVDPIRGTVYIGTGDNYSVPTDPAYLSCVANSGAPSACQSPQNYADSILALDMRTGAIKWGQRMQTWNQAGVNSGTDFFNLACTYGLPGCPSPEGPDFDFGSAPQEITYLNATGLHTIIGAGQKSGIYFALDPDTGKIIWQTQVAPGSSLGGMEWGSATDGLRIYTAVTNFYGLPTPIGTNAGVFTALDVATGKILWQVADPNESVDLGSLSVAGGVVYAPSMAGASTAHNMLALNAATGKTLWSFPAGSSVIAGATVVNGNVYWGSGYAHLGPFLPEFTAGNTFYAFSIEGK